MKIIYTLKTEIYLRELTEILYYKEHFGLRETAKKYVDSLTEEIEATIHIRPKRKAPDSFSRYGRELWYVFYTRSKNTTWYFFFTLHEEDTYIIRYITNNHVAGHLLE